MTAPKIGPKTAASTGALITGLKAIGHPLRYAILQELSGQELNVGEIEKATGITQPALSQQLAFLRNAGLVSTRKDAKLVYYSSEPARLAEVIGGLKLLLPENAAPKSAGPKSTASKPTASKPTASQSSGALPSKHLFSGAARFAKVG